MEIESLHKYISLNKMANGTTEVLFSGQPCLSIQENGFDGTGSSYWKINPVFAKLVYGANVAEDVPMCTDFYSSTEEAVAGGLVRLHELGAFNTEVDLPDDSYGAPEVFESIKQDFVNTITEGNVVESYLSAVTKYKKMIREWKFQVNESLRLVSKHGESGGKTAKVYKDTEWDEHRVKFFNKEGKHMIDADYHTDDKKEAQQNADHWVKNESVDESFNDDDYYLLDKDKKRVVDNLGKRKVQQSTRPWADPELSKYIKSDSHTVLRGMQARHQGYTNESADDEYMKWQDDCKAAHPDKKLLFKVRTKEDGGNIVSAEEHSGDRSHGVFDQKEGKGKVFGTNESVESIDERELTSSEKNEAEKIVRALKKDKKFMAVYGKDSAYAIATAKAKEVV